MASRILQEDFTLGKALTRMKTTYRFTSCTVDVKRTWTTVAGRYHRAKEKAHPVHMGRIGP